MSARYRGQTHPGARPFGGICGMILFGSSFVQRGMPRAVQLSVPPDETDELCNALQTVPGLFGLRVQRGISLHPQGDVIALEIANRSLPTLMAILADKGFGQRKDRSVTISEPTAIVSADWQTASRDASESPHEEMELTLAKDSNMTVYSLGLMAVAGAITAFGIETNALHLVVGAMVIAPGFEPLVRISHGLIARASTWRYGLSDFVKGFATLMVASGAVALILSLLGKQPLGGEQTYLPRGVLVDYWTSTTLESALASALAAIAGAILVATHRSILTAGVMIALALVPAAALIGMGLALGRMDVAAAAAVRFLTDVGLVLVVSAAVLAAHRAWSQKRGIMLADRS
jgi:hypothetical protein